MNLKQRVANEFQGRFGTPPQFIVRVPGRVNLIGEHTDYNDGFMLPMAIDRAIWIALRRQADRRIVLHSLDFAEPANFSLDGVQHADGWVEYVMGSAWILGEGGFPAEGWEGVLAEDIPIGAGLSSSAALELALLKVFWAISPWAWDGTLMARLARRIENEWVGVQSGIMDQMISSLGRAGHALLIDCRSLEATSVPVLAENGNPFWKCALNRRVGYNRGLDPQTAKAHLDIPTLLIHLSPLAVSKENHSELDQAR